MRLFAGVTVAAVAGVLAVAGIASATPQMLSAAKKAGLPANNCQYCHGEALPKKETFKPDTLNDRGKFLLSDMQKRNLKAPDVQKLKDYAGTEKK